jgi:hypothetical protein
MISSRDRDIDRTITNNVHRLRKYGVLTALPGYEVKGHQLIGRRALLSRLSISRSL